MLLPKVAKLWKTPRVPITPSQFAQRWSSATLSERAGAQSHFLDLCQMLGEAHPAATDSVGERFTFEKHVSRISGGKGFADVWRRDHFAWEYKGKHKDLDAAYRQLNEYREDLMNPPLLVVCDMRTFKVHTNFGKTKKRIYKFDLHDLELNKITAECPLPPLEVLTSLFNDTDRLRPERTDAFVTQEAAKVFARMAERLEIEKRSLTDSPIATKEEISHFLLRLLFCLFADSIGLLPNHVFRRLIDSEDRFTPRIFLRKLRNLFKAMAEPDGIFGEYTIKHFNGGLFDSASVIELDRADLGLLHEVATRYDWSHVAPAIFGTLFERSLDPARRSLIGAHYTSEADILLLVEPVIVQPTRNRWEQTRSSIATLLERRAATAVDTRKSVRKQTPNEASSKQTVGKKSDLRPGPSSSQESQAEELLAQFFEYIASIRVLDPACGSGNFLYVALRKLLDLWLEARDFAIHHGLRVATQFAADHMVSPSQLLGIEVEYYAHELASVVVWIGFIQWKIEHGIFIDRQPILERLTNIEHGDAILRYHTQTKEPYEPVWPKANFVVGNPPFLGGKLLRRHLGDKYVDDLFAIYEGHVKAESDLVVYWFSKALPYVVSGRARVGLLATQAIRAGANLLMLKQISERASIFFAWSNREWLLNGADVRVSMIGFDDGSETILELDGKPVSSINANLSSGVDVTAISILKENDGIAFQGPVKVGRFEVEPDLARKMLRAPLNPNKRPNSDVVIPWVIARDLTDRGRGMHIIDFENRSMEEAALYEMPFEYVRHHVYPTRLGNKRARRKEYWWQHGERNLGMRRALSSLDRYIASPRVSKHRVFSFVASETLADSRVVVIARSDDYFIGILESSVHLCWSLANSSRHGVGNDITYNIETCFDTFPFPWSPGLEPSEVEDRRVKAIAEASRELMGLRNNWLDVQHLDATEIKNRTLTNLYNKRPSWLENAHQTLDRAVFAAYGLTYPLSKDGILQHLLALNHRRSAGELIEIDHDRAVTRKKSVGSIGLVDAVALSKTKNR